MGSPGGTGRRGGAPGSARRAPASAAWRSPSGESGVSACPWKRPSASQTDWPWRRRTSDAARSGGTASGATVPGTSVTRNRRARRPRCREHRPSPGCDRRRRPARRRRSHPGDGRCSRHLGRRARRFRVTDVPGTVAPLAAPPDLAAALFRLRHGQSVWLAEGRFQGQADTPLSPLGERQAALAGARLADPGAPPRLPVPPGDPIAIVHSPLARTAQTAAAVATAIAARGREAPPLVPEPGLREIGQGAWEGLYQRDVEAGWPAEIAGWRRDPVRAYAPGGESLSLIHI